MPDDHRERVVELVRHARQQRAERAQLLVLTENLPLPLELRLDPLGLGQIDHRRDHRILAFERDQARGEGPPELGAVGPPQAHLEAVEPALAPDPLDDRRPLADVGVDPVRGAGEHLGQRDAEQLGKGRAREDHVGGIEVGDEQRHRVSFGERPKALLAGLEPLLDLLLPGDVDIEAADMADRGPRRRGSGTGSPCSSCTRRARRRAPRPRRRGRSRPPGGRARRPARHRDRRRRPPWSGRASPPPGGQRPCSSPDWPARSGRRGP